MLLLKIALSLGASAISQYIIRTFFCSITTLAPKDSATSKDSATKDSATT